MALGRFFAVLLIVAALGLTLGGLTGWLIGVAVPQKVTVETKGAAGVNRGLPSPDDGPKEAKHGVATAVEVAATADKSTEQSAAALGGAFGLMAGVGVGLIVAIIDQLLLAFRQRSKRDGGNGRSHASDYGPHAGQARAQPAIT